MGYVKQRNKWRKRDWKESCGLILRAQTVRPATGSESLPGISLTPHLIRLAEEDALRDAAAGNGAVHQDANPGDVPGLPAGLPVSPGPTPQTMSTVSRKLLRRAALAMTAIGAIGVLLTTGYFLNTHSIDPVTGQHYDALGQPMHKSILATGPTDDGWRASLPGEIKKLLATVAYSLPWLILAALGYFIRERLRDKPSDFGRQADNYFKGRGEEIVARRRIVEAAQQLEAEEREQASGPRATGGATGINLEK